MKPVKNIVGISGGDKMERWRIVIELTYDLKEGDSVIDRLGRGPELDRAKQKLNTLLNGEPFAHYHILLLPHRCIEFD
jgi:hypothetical protein